ncbi:MAG: hypothetical protein RTU30_10010 [Candidatus Thorarchaeota archaeon]
MSNATERLREEYLNAFMMRKWVSSKLNRLTHEQLELLYGMVKRWINEEEVSRI